MELIDRTTMWIIQDQHGIKNRILIATSMMDDAHSATLQCLYSKVPFSCRGCYYANLVLEPQD